MALSHDVYRTRLSILLSWFLRPVQDPLAMAKTAERRNLSPSLGAASHRNTVVSPNPHLATEKGIGSREYLAGRCINLTSTKKDDKNLQLLNFHLYHEKTGLGLA